MTMRKLLPAFLLVCATAFGQANPLFFQSSFNNIPPAATPTFSPGAGTYGGTQSVTISTSTSGCGSYLVYNTTGASSGGNLTGTTPVSGAVSVATSETLYAQVQSCPSYLNSGIGSAAYVINVPPTMTYRYAGSNSSNTCTTGGALPCTINLQSFYSAADYVASNTATAAGTLPTYLTSAIDSKPGIQWIEGTSTPLTLATDIPSSLTSITMYAVMQWTNGGHEEPIVGTSASNPFGWSINTSGEQHVYANNNAVSDGTIVLNTSVTVVMTYNFSSGVYTFGHCSSGVLVSDGSGTQAMALSSPSATYIGADGYGQTMGMNLAELGILENSTSTTGICGWSLAQYGI